MKKGRIYGEKNPKPPRNTTTKRDWKFRLLFNKLPEIGIHTYLECFTESTRANRDVTISIEPSGWRYVEPQFEKTLIFTTFLDLTKYIQLCTNKKEDESRLLTFTYAAWLKDKDLKKLMSLVCKVPIAMTFSPTSKILDSLALLSEQTEAKRIRQEWFNKD